MHFFQLLYQVLLYFRIIYVIVNHFLSKWLINTLFIHILSICSTIKLSKDCQLGFHLGFN